MDYKNEEIKNRIEEIMREKGLSGKGLAEDLSYDQSSISAVLNLKRSPMALIEKMSEAYGISKTWFLTGGGTKFTSSEQIIDKKLANVNNLSIEERAKMINDVNQLYKRHQDLLEEASKVMKQIVELNKALLINNI
jgi:transcriptional regulator with XRE-family HTH domain